MSEIVHLPVPPQPANPLVEACKVCGTSPYTALELRENYTGRAKLDPTPTHYCVAPIPGQRSNCSCGVEMIYEPAVGWMVGLEQSDMCDRDWAPFGGHVPRTPPVGNGVGSARLTRWFDPVSPGGVLDVEFVVRAIGLARSAGPLGATLDVAFIKPGTLDEIESYQNVQVHEYMSATNNALVEGVAGLVNIDFTKVVSLRFSVRSVSHVEETP